MFKFVQFNHTKRYIAQKLYSFLCNFTCYKSITKILQNGYKWLQTCNRTGSTKVAGAVSIVYTGRASMYTRKGATNELRLRSYIWGAVSELRLELYLGATFGELCSRAINAAVKSI